MCFRGGCGRNGVLMAGSGGMHAWAVYFMPWGLPGDVDWIR